MVTNNSQAIVQSLVPDNLRGRVMGVYTLIFFGSMPIGSLLAGSVAAMDRRTAYRDGGRCPVAGPGNCRLDVPAGYSQAGLAICDAQHLPWNGKLLTPFDGIKPGVQLFRF